MQLARATRFSGGLHPAPFTASAGVQTDVTAPSVGEFMKELEAAVLGVTADELAFTKAALEQAEVRSYESARARLGLIDAAAKYGWPDDYVEERLAALQGFSVEDLRALAREHITPERMTILVVGDKSEVLEELQGLGRGPVIELDVDGVPLAGEE
jgi:zinc protease